MIIRQATAEDSKVWDHYVAAHPLATPYHKFAWGQACLKAYKQTPIYLIAQNPTGDICGVFPIILFKRPLSSGSLCSLPYCDTGFVLADDDSIKHSLFSHANTLATSQNFTIDYRDASNDIAQKEAISDGQKVVMRMSLPEDSETLLSSFKSKLRSQVRKAEKNGLTTQVSASWIEHSNQLDAFYNVFKQNMRQLASPVHSKAWFAAILQGYDYQCRLAVVYYNDIPVGAGIILLNGKTAVIPWASTVQQYNRLAPNMQLYWSLLANATDSGMQVFDFGRSSFSEGTYKFKSQWGAHPYLLKWSDSFTPTQISPAVSAPRGPVRNLAQSVWPRLPLGLTVTLGSAIRKYISL